MARPAVRYASSTGDVDVAYQVMGDGPVDLVFVSGFISHLDLTWELPVVSWLEQLDGVARVLVFDKRGTGLSDRSLGFGSIEERTDDIRAVMDAAGSQSAFLVGASEGGPMSLLFSAMFPERVCGLVLYGTGPRFSQADDWPWGPSKDDVDRFVDFVRAKWGTGRVFELFLQGAPDPDAARQLIARIERNACTPKMAAEIMRRNLEIDVRPTLSSITAPTLVVHSEDDPLAHVEGAKYLADHIPGARLRLLPGAFHLSWRPEDVAGLRDAALELVAGGGMPQLPVSRVLATVLFTDIVRSTERAADVGDDAWRSLLDQHDRVARSHIEQFGGRFVKTTGDGVLATFDGPSRAISCARELGEAVRTLDLHLRAGVHTGEVELRGDDVAGMGVVIARRICDLAGDGTVLVSRTVKDLVTGSGIRLEDHGSHRLKGVPEVWQLYAAV